MEFDNFLSKNGKGGNIKITLEDFPDDIYILLEDEFRAKFFKTAWKTNKSYRHLAKKIGVSNPTMLSWRRGRINYTNQDQYCPLWAIKEIINQSNLSGMWKYDLNEVQNNINSIRCKTGVYKIFNVKLPIKDSIELREIVTHLICDGSALNEKHRTSKFASSNLKTVELLKEKLESVFGTIPNIKIRIRTYPNHYLDCYILNFPKAITKILSHKFKIDFRSNKARLPKEFFNGSKDKQIAIVRTFFIDEGCVNDRTIYFCSGSPELLEDLKMICHNLGYKCRDIRDSNRTHYLGVSPHSFEKFYGDMKKLGQLPIKQKQKLLDLGFAIIKNKANFKKLNENILNLLKLDSSTTLELAKRLIINTKTIGERLIKLERNGIVKRLGRTKGRGGPQIWGVTS